MKTFYWCNVNVQASSFVLQSFYNLKFFFMVFIKVVTMYSLLWLWEPDPLLFPPHRSLNEGQVDHLCLLHFSPNKSWSLSSSPINVLQMNLNRFSKYALIHTSIVSALLFLQFTVLFTSSFTAMHHFQY